MKKQINSTPEFFKFFIEITCNYILAFILMSYCPSFMYFNVLCTKGKPFSRRLLPERNPKLKVNASEVHYKKHRYFDTMPVLHLCFITVRHAEFLFTPWGGNIILLLCPYIKRRNIIFFVAASNPISNSAKYVIM